MEIILVNSELQSKALLSLLQEYELEFSAITKKTPDENGQFKLDVELDKTDNYLLYIDAKIAGLAVKGTHSGRHDIFEFYVRPQYRGNLVGQKFTHEIFKKYKGLWQVRQIEGADLARDFWRKAISNYTSGNYTEQSVKDDYWGDITVQYFES